MADEQGEKTEKPTDKKVKEARERGQVAVSRDLSTALSSLAATGALVAAGSMLLHRLTAAISQGILRLGEVSRQDLMPEDLMPILLSHGQLIALIVGPIAIAAAATGVFSSVVQAGFNFSPKALQLNWGRLNPAAGFGKLAPSKAGLDTLKTIVTGAVLAVVAWRLGKAVMDDSARMVWANPLVSAGRGWQEGMRLFWQAGFALLSVGAIDYGLQKWRLAKSLRMSHKELRQEAKNSEPNPEIKAKVRRIQRDMARQRMMQAVPTATVILTNPTHFAVALEYRRDKNPAPVVVAKGADLVAAKIREIARAHSVPIVENPALARAIFKECELGDTIPGPLFGAVAEVLAYLIRIKQLVL